MFSTLKKDDAQDNVCCSANEVGQKVRELIDTSTHNVRDAAAVTEKQIRQHPLTASAIAAGVGFLLGALFSRR